MGVAPDVPVWMVRLLSARDLTVTQCSLCTLTNISKRWAGGGRGGRGGGGGGGGGGGAEQDTFLGFS